MAREMKDSGIPWIGEIPADWSLIATKRLYKIESGATPKSENSDYYDGSIPWITPADFKTNDVFVFCGRRNITELGLNSCGTILIQAKSIIFSKRAPIGAVAINKVDLCTNQGCLSCIPKVDLEVKYFYYAMSIFTKQYNLLGTGTTFKEISTTDFANFVLPYPSLYQQQKMVRNVFDAQSPRKIKSVDNVFGNFLASKGLYDEIEITKDNIFELADLVGGHVKIDVYCPKCGESRVFLCEKIPYYWYEDQNREIKAKPLETELVSWQLIQSEPRPHVVGTPEEPWTWTNNSLENDTRLMVFMNYVKKIA